MLSYPMGNQCISSNRESIDGGWINIPHTSIQVQDGLLFIRVHKSEATLSMDFSHICTYVH